MIIIDDDNSPLMGNQVFLFTRFVMSKIRTSNLNVTLNCSYPTLYTMYYVDHMVLQTFGIGITRALRTVTLESTVMIIIQGKMDRFHLFYGNEREFGTFQSL